MLRLDSAQRLLYSVYIPFLSYEEKQIKNNKIPLLFLGIRFLEIAVFFSVLRLRFTCLVVIFFGYWVFSVLG